jgi:hypothetical protein
MRKLDLDPMDDDDDYDRRSRTSSYEHVRSDTDEAHDSDEDLMIPGSSGRRGERMSEVEEPIFEM